MEIIRYVDKAGKLFLDPIRLTDGKADSLVAALEKYSHMKGIPTHTISGLTNDSTTVMTRIITSFLYPIKTAIGGKATAPQCPLDCSLATSSLSGRM